ncbi:hypothetical protein ES707_20576 [subsurface metagenome]
MNAWRAAMASSFDATGVRPRPEMVNSPAEIILVIPACILASSQPETCSRDLPRSSRCISRTSGPFINRTGWVCESIRPGTRVVPFASTTKSAEFAAISSAVPMALIFPSSILIASASKTSFSISPETMVPTLMIAAFIFRLLVFLYYRLYNQNIRYKRFIHESGRE